MDIKLLLEEIAKICDLEIMYFDKYNGSVAISRLVNTESYITDEERIKLELKKKM